jgi:hypothetical protein
MNNIQERLIMLTLALLLNILQFTLQVTPGNRDILQISLK